MENNSYLEKIKKCISSNELIIYPTDTVYGVGCNLNSVALAKLYFAKNRPHSSPIIALISKREKLNNIVYINHKELANKLMDNFWPGALTLIFKKKDIIPPIMVANGDTVGVRIPDSQLARDIIECVGGIMPTTSANISKHATPRNFAELDFEFTKKAKMVVRGLVKLGIESTIIDLSGNKPKIVRIGALAKEEIEKKVGNIDWEE